MRFQIDEHVCLFFLKKFASLFCTYVHYYHNPVRLFIFEKKYSPVRLLGPVWLFRASEYLRSQ